VLSTAAGASAAIAGIMRQPAAKTTAVATIVLKIFDMTASP
jgi:hypothetical protein